MRIDRWTKTKWLVGCLAITIAIMYIYASIYEKYKDEYSEIGTREDATYFSCLIMFAVGSSGISPKTNKGRAIVISQIIIFWFLILGFSILIVE